jgi:hypothetical protein
VRYPETRFVRRLRARRLAVAVAAAEAAQPPPVRHPLGDPRVGEDRRQAERRTHTMTPAEVEEWLRRNGIPGGDRRRGDRRQGDRRRR